MKHEIVANTELIITDDCFEMVKHFEGFREYPYQCSSNYWTIGYGSWLMPDGAPVSTVVKRQGWRKFRITESEADAMLRKMLPASGGTVLYCVKVELTVPQFNALASFQYNLVNGAFKKSTLLRLLNLGMYDNVPSELRRWVKSGGETSTGLVRRRNAEAAMWMGEDWKQFKR